jgi:hypothetical protein
MSHGYGYTQQVPAKAGLVRYHLILFFFQLIFAPQLESALSVVFADVTAWHDPLLATAG